MRPEDLTQKRVCHVTDRELFAELARRNRNRRVPYFSILVRGRMDRPTRIQACMQGPPLVLADMAVQLTALCLSQLADEQLESGEWVENLLEDDGKD